MKKLLRMKDKDKEKPDMTQKRQMEKSHQQQQHLVRNQRSVDDIRSQTFELQSVLSNSQSPRTITNENNSISNINTTLNAFASSTNYMKSPTLSTFDSTSIRSGVPPFDNTVSSTFQSSNNPDETAILDETLNDDTVLLNTNNDATNPVDDNVIMENTANDEIASLKQSMANHPLVTNRRNSHASTTSTVISTNTEIKKMITNDFKKLGRNIKSTKISSPLHSPSKDQSSNLYNSNTNPNSISSLVNPDWDNSILKNGWINKISDSNDSKLFRLELKGSNLLVYKLTPELSYARNLIINSNDNILDNSDSISMLQNDFTRSTSDLPLNTKSSKSNIDIMNDIETAVGADGDDLDTNNIPKSESRILSQVIDDYENSKIIEDEENDDDDKDEEGEEDEEENNDEKEEDNNNYDDNDIDAHEPINDCNMDKSSNSNNNLPKHLPLIIHELSYKSPTCPHPKLRFDTLTGFILSGSLEAICHTILFYPSVRISEKLIEILPLINNLSDPLVYFIKFLDHFTDTEYLTKNNIKITDMELSLLFTRVKLVIELSLNKFNGCFLDDEIFNLYKKLAVKLSKKSTKYLETEDIENLLKRLNSRHDSLLKLTSFELDKSPVEKSDLISGCDFLMLDIESLANEIHAIDLHFMRNWSPRSDRSLIFSRLETIQASFNYWKYNPLQFIPQFHTHYLGRLLLYHLFEDETISNSSKKRAQILMKWIHLGTLLSEQGDMVSWLGIAIVICSQPILRLGKTWSHVDKSYLQAIRKKWAPVAFEVRKNELFSSTNSKLNEQSLESKDLNDDVNSINSNKLDRIMITNKVGEVYNKSDSVPYFGELFTIDKLSLKSEKLAEKDEDDIFGTDFIKTYCSYLEIVDWNLKQWDTYFETIENLPDVKSKFDCSEDEGAKNLSIYQGSNDSKISSVLQTAIKYNSQNGPFLINSLMETSTSIEPPYVGKFAAFHGISRSPLFLGSYASILFPEILPSYQIYDRKQLIGAIGGSNIYDSSEVKYKNRNIVLKHIRDLFNVGCEEFKLIDDSIVFKTCDLIAPRENNDKSKPSSVLFEDPKESKHMSTLSTSSFDLEYYILSYQSYLRDSIKLEKNSKSSTPTSSASSTFKEHKVEENKTDHSSQIQYDNKRVNIITAAATPDRLIDLLVLTASVFGMHIKMDDVQNYSEKTGIEGPILLQMNDSVFTYTFFATYRVFYTTKQLVDALHKRFIGSKGAALSIVDFVLKKDSLSISNGDIFPRWDDEIENNDSTWNKINWKFVIQIQLGIIESTLILVNDYFMHFMDDIETKSTFDSFLETMDITIVSQWPKILKWLEKNDNFSKDSVNEIIEVYKSLQNVYKQVRNICIRKSYTPQCEPVELDYSAELSAIPDEFNLPSSTNIDEIVKFVNKLDNTIKSVISLIRKDDWIDTFEILEMLVTKSPLSMFNYDFQDASVHQSLINISNIYHWIITLKDDGKLLKSNDKIINKLPSTIKSIFKLYERVQKYVLVQIIDSKISIDDRIDKMCTLLKIIQLSRLRMKNVELFTDIESNLKLKSDSKSLYIPSFIESVVVNTIMLPESRFFSHAWKLAVSVWNPSNLDNDLIFESLESMLPVLSDYECEVIKNQSILSICPGWILNRLVEIACFIPNMDVDNSMLINFDKNRLIYNCVLKIHNLVQSKLKMKNLLTPYLTDFSFLFEFDLILPNLKTIYKQSANERDKEKLSNCRVFGKHITDQVKLLELEKKKRTLFMRQREIQIRKNNKQLTQSTDNVDTISILSNSTTNSNGTSNIINNSFDSNNISNSTAVNSLLDSQSLNSTSQNSHLSTITKPSPNASARHTQLKKQTISTQPPKSASSITSNGSHKFKFGFFKSRPFSLNINNFNQPVAEKRSVKLDELPNANVFVINSISKSKPYFNIMLKDVAIFPTYRTPNSFTIDLGNHHEYTFQTADEEEVSDWLYKLVYAKKHWFYSRVFNKQFYNNNIKLTFGAPLQFVCQRDNSPIPLIIEKILSEIELRGLEEVGIYRKSASLIVVQQIKDEVNKRGDFNMENSLVFDIHNLTGCIKAYLRELPEPLINDALVEEISIIKEFSKSEERFKIYKDILAKLPTFNYSLVERLSRHMKLIEEYKMQNKMTSYNLATIMGGSLVEGCKPGTIGKSFGLMNFVCEDWILHYERIFH